MRPLTDICFHVCCFLDDTGRYVGRKKVNFNTLTFNFLGVPYVFDSTKFQIKGGNFLNWTKYYCYHVGNPEPIVFKQNYVPLMTPVEFGNVINTKKLQELNDLAKSDNLFSKLFKSPIFWVLLIVVLGLAYWLYSHGGKLW